MVSVVSGRWPGSRLLGAEWREPRVFEVCQARRWRRSRRSQRGRGRGQEGGLEVTVREEETRREVGHEGRIRGEERTHGARRRACARPVRVCRHMESVHREKNWTRLYTDED